MEKKSVVLSLQLGSTAGQELGMVGSVLVTGAGGFLGRYVITELIGHCPEKYQNIIAVDMVSSDNVASMFKFCPYVLPVRIDLTKLMDKTSMEYEAFEKMLDGVETVIHLAAIVETRENSRIQELVKVCMCTSYLPQTCL